MSASLRKPINDHCRSCIYDPAAPGNWRQQVEGCTCKSCSLWPIRPVSRRESSKQHRAGTTPPQEAIHAQEGTI